MAKSKLIEYMKNYLYDTYVPEEDGLLAEIKDKYWSWKLEHMKEGEIMDRYYQLTTKKVN